MFVLNAYYTYKHTNLPRRNIWNSRKCLMFLLNLVTDKHHFKFYINDKSDEKRDDELEMSDLETDDD